MNRHRALFFPCLAHLFLLAAVQPFLPALRRAHGADRKRRATALRPRPQAVPTHRPRGGRLVARGKRACARDIWKVDRRILHMMSGRMGVYEASVHVKQRTGSEEVWGRD
jgi:hypothetical protein